MGKHKSLILLGSAVLIALVTTLLIVRVLQKKTTEKDRASIETQPIMVALVDLSWGTSLTKDMIKVVPFPKEYVPPGCFSSADALAGRVLVYPVKMNEPIFESRLAPKTIQTGGVAALISPKKRAVSVKVDKIIGVSGFIHAGNRVDVLVTLASGRSSTPVTKIVLENILILAVGPDLEKKGKDPTPVDTITLEVTPEEAEKLALAATEGKVQLALRNFNDTEDVHTRGITIPTLLASYAGASPERKKTEIARNPKGNRSSASTTSPSPAAPARSGRMVVELIKGGKIQEVKFERSE
jgi:pilus assembly protein CpaB